MRIDSPDVNVVPAIPRWLGNLLELQLVDDVADQLAGLLVVEEQRRPVAVQHAGRLRHDAGEQRRQLELRSQIGDQVQEVDLPLALARHPLEPLKRLEADGAIPCHALEQREVAHVEGALRLVQQLHDPDRASLCVLDRGADQRRRRVPRLLIDVAVEARIRVRVMHDLADAAVEHSLGNAEVVQEPDLSRSKAGGNVRVELTGLVVVQEDRTLVGCDLLNCRLEQGVDCGVEGVERRNPTRERAAAEAARATRCTRRPRSPCRSSSLPVQLVAYGLNGGLKLSDLVGGLLFLLL